MFAVRYRYWLILLLGLYSYLNILYTTGEKLLDVDIPSWVLLVLLIITVLAIWEFNRLVDHVIFTGDFQISKIHPLVQLFLASLVGVGAVCLIVLLLLYQFAGIPHVMNGDHFRLLLAFGFRVNLFLHCLNAIVFFMNRYKKAQLEAEQLKKTTVEARFEALRAQINPHFLFNCFNVLSSLVYKDADTSAHFIGQLSKVYRYLLYNQDKKLVTLHEELSFLESYLFLIKIRFSDNLAINTRIDSGAKERYIAPAVLQMLIENAIKHNVVSKRSPLAIDIHTTENAIVVSNTLQLKEIREESSRRGLKNIIGRYLLLSDESVMVESDQWTFKVTIPLLELEK